MLLLLWAPINKHRGGKLAALQYASNPAIKTSYLIDPVDNTVFSPESDAYPSAVKALQQQDPRKIAGVTGAGITSLCNPEGSNYSKFYDALGPGSWFVVLPQATHLALAETPLAATHICGKGTTTPLVSVMSTRFQTYTFRNSSQPVPLLSLVLAPFPLCCIVPVWRS